MRALLLALGQLDDPACFGVLARSVGLALLAYVALMAGSIWGIHALLASVHWPGWLAALLGTVGVLLLAFWRFLPTVMLIATLNIDRGGWAIGRGLFVAVAMRRMGRADAQFLYRRHRIAVLLPGLLLAAAATLPGVNLLVPIVGIAAMVHVLNANLRAQHQSALK